MDIEQINEFEYLLWLERQKPEYDLKIIYKKIIRKYKIKELKELKAILEEYKGKEISIELCKVRKKQNDV